MYMEPKGLNASKRAVEDFAEAVANHLGFKPGDDVSELVHRLGGKIVYETHALAGSDSGYIEAATVNDFTIYLSTVTARTRDRFTMAHELGHLFLHLDDVKRHGAHCVMRATRHVNFEDPSQQRAEWEANWFAAAFLMPAGPFKETWQSKKAWTPMQFDVSPAAAEVRAKSLGL